MTLSTHRRTALRRAPAAALALASAALGLTLPAGTAHAAPAGCAPGVWKAEFFPNTTFRGTPKKTACDDVIAENYGTGAPAGTGLPRDGFGVRWTTTRDFGSGGPFTFTAEATDGVRVYLDNVLKIDEWKDVPKTRKKAVRVTVPKGKHTLRVNYAAFTGPANVKFSYTPVTAKADDKTAPLAPAGVRAAFDRKTGRTTLRWTPNNEQDLAGYTVHRRVLPARGKPGAWTVVSGKKPLTAASFTDRPKANGDGYAYAVTATDKAGNVSRRSAEARITTPGKPVPALPAPHDVAASGEPDGTTVTWQAAPGPGFHVYRSERPSGPWTRLTREPFGGYAYIDTTAPFDTAVYYYVTSVSDGAESPASAVVKADRPRVTDTTAPAAPTGLRVETEGKAARLTWDGNTEPDLSHYRVQRRRGSYDEPWTTVAERVEGTSYTDRPKNDGTVYVYTIIAVDTHRNESARSVTAAYRSPNLTPPEAPRYVTASQDRSGDVLLGWNESRRAETYRIYRADDEGEPYELIATVRPDIPGAQQYIDRDTTPGMYRFYVLTAVDRDGNESERSNRALGRRGLPSTAQDPARPTDLTAVVNRNAITLTWRQPDNPRGARIQKYRVYRYEGGKVNPSLITEIPYALSYTDTKLVPNTGYQYRVMAVDVQGRTSGLSDTAVRRG
ncbi:fibronectin type III domain-containing protein [Streptomyces sp. URMC 126]|uniref:fibronectin type III domain-containing protein n=1 Tax=Streptomyces sp. URMC 126 TaxID=3423401 RepID=UPI003F1A7E97